MNQEQRMSENQERDVRHTARVFQITMFVFAGILFLSIVFAMLPPLLASFQYQPYQPSPAAEPFRWLGVLSAFALTLLAIIWRSFRASSPHYPRQTSSAIHLEYGTVAAYERGDPAQRPPPLPVSQEEIPRPETDAFQPEYEQSLAPYPEMPPMRASAREPRSVR